MDTERLILSDNPTGPLSECTEDELQMVGQVIWVGRRI
jgi:phage repressor protein C with HTH and peptisase S24 domain